MRYAAINKNDIVNGEGVCVSFWTVGCPHKCQGCHNSELWDFDGGKEFTPAALDELLTAISANGIQRNFSILGGEPLCEENTFLTAMVIEEVRRHYPNIKIYLWTGYYLEQLNQNDSHIKYILDNINYLIDGPYEEDKRDIALKLRGSSNQHILAMRGENCGS